MRAAAACLVLACIASPLIAQTPQPAQDAQHVEPVPNAVASQLLHALIPEGKNTTTVTTLVVNTSVNDVNLGMYCSSSSTSGTQGTIDDNGNISTTTNSSGGTTCRERHVYHDTMVLSLLEKDSPNNSYLLTAVCTERWVWNHCGMPPKGSAYPLVIQIDKHGQFTVLVATSDRIGSKPKVAKFAIIQLSHVTGAAAKNS